MYGELQIIVVEKIASKKKHLIKGKEQEAFTFWKSEFEVNGFGQIVIGGKYSLYFLERVVTVFMNTILCILTSLIILLHDELPSVAVFETGKGHLGLGIKVNFIFLQWANVLPLYICLHIALNLRQQRNGEERNFIEGPSLKMSTAASCQLTQRSSVWDASADWEMASSPARTKILYFKDEK